MTRPRVFTTGLRTGYRPALTSSECREKDKITQKSTNLDKGWRSAILVSEHSHTYGKTNHETERH